MDEDKCCGTCLYWHKKEYIHCQCSGYYGGDIKGDDKCTWKQREGTRGGTMTVYENDKGTQWKVGFTEGPRGKWRIKRIPLRGDWVWLMRDWYPSEQYAQIILDQMAQRKGWKKKEKP